jgi:hypothetical protein
MAAEAFAVAVLKAHGPEHVLYGRELAVWMACGHCDTVLVRVYDLEPWGHAGVANAYGLVHPTWKRSAEPSPWPSTELHAHCPDALDALDRCGT